MRNEMWHLPVQFSARDLRSEPFREQKDSAYFICVLLWDPGSPQPRPSYALTLTLKGMPMIFNLRSGAPRYLLVVSVVLLVELHNYIV